MKGVLIVVALIALSGCGLTPQGDMIRSTVAERGAAAADASLENVLWGLCKAIPVGALQRYFAGSSQRADAWFMMCSQDATTVPIPALPVE